MLRRSIASKLIQRYLDETSRGNLAKALSATTAFGYGTVDDDSIRSNNRRSFKTTSSLCGIHIEEEVYNRQRSIIHLGERIVTVAPDSWVAPSAVCVGDVDLYGRSSVWHNCVLRGDLESIKIGEFSNVLDRTVIHAARSTPTGLPAATTIGRSVTIGQGCLLRSVTVDDECIIGDRCIMLEGSIMEKNSILAPGSVLPPGRRIPPGELWSGTPARFVRKLTKDEKAEIPLLAAAIYPSIEAHRAEFLPQSSAYREAEHLRSILKPEAAVVKGADLEAVGKEEKN